MIFQRESNTEGLVERYKSHQQWSHIKTFVKFAIQKYKHCQLFLNNYIPQKVYELWPFSSNIFLPYIFSLHEVAQYWHTCNLQSQCFLMIPNSTIDLSSIPLLFAFFFTSLNGSLIKNSTVLAQQTLQINSLHHRK